MRETLSFVNLNCLNCGAKLKITDNIFEFACQYCGATQIVERTGGIVALKFLSDKLDRVQSSVDRTAAELKIQRLKNELEELEEKHTELDEITIQLKSTVNPIAATVFVSVLAAFLLVTAYTGSIIPLLIGGIVAFIIFWLWRMYINRIDSEFDKSAKPLIEKGIEIKRKIAELEKIVEF